MARQQRADIVRAAIEVFRERGYERATVRDIAAAANLGSSSALYAHVRSKEELLLEAVRPLVEQARERMEAIASSDADPAEKLRAAIVAVTSSFDEHHPEVFIYLREFFPLLETGEEGDRPGGTAVDRVWVDIVQEGIRTGVFREDADAKIVAFGVLGMCNWMHTWYRPGGGRSAGDIGAEFARVILDGLRAR